MQAMVQKTPFWMSQVHTDAANGTLNTPTQVWMTPAGEMLHITAQGRLSSTFGTAYADWTRSHSAYMPTNWRQVHTHLMANKEVQYQRERDVSPGGFANIQERITITALKQAPKIDWLHPLPLAEQLHWFEEHAQLRDPAGRWALLPASNANTDPMGQALPPARFAVAFFPDGSEQVVYSEQCLSHAVCLRMQHWSPPQAAAHP